MLVRLRAVDLEFTINSANDLLGIKEVSIFKQHQLNQFVCATLNMKLLLLLSLIILAWGDGALVAEKTAENNDVFSQASRVLQAQPSIQEVLEEKKLGKRSLLPVAYVGTYTPVLPWYRLGGLSSYKLHGYGWYPGWSLHGGWQSGWYKGW